MAGIYVHIPFCESKCIYCDFYSVADASEQLEHYVDCLLREAALRKEEVSEPILTLYFGGGTPSMMSASQLSKLIHGLCDTFDLSSLQEFTVEVNPDDVTTHAMETLHDLGVNRVSMGIQSFHDDELRFINRRHTARQAIEAVQAAHWAGIQNISIDLICGIPNQTLALWRENVDRAISLGVQHISAYSMMYEKGTRLWVMRQAGKIKEIDEDVSLAMYKFLIERMERSGYRHYEISNFSLPGFESKHNSNYWNLTPYLGLGAAAHSFDGEIRRYNPDNLKTYLITIDKGIAAFETERETREERYDEYVMLRLRTASGLSLTKVKDRFGEKAVTHIMQESAKHVSGGLLSHQGDTLHLTRAGVMLSDMVTRDLMW